MKRIVALTSLVVLSACGSTAALSAHGNRVQVVESEPVHCRDMGTFFGRGSAPQYALNNLRNVVGEEGGNRVYLTRAEELVRAPFSNTITVLGNDHTVYGRGFDCTQG